MRCTFDRDGDFMACSNPGCDRKVLIVDPTLPPSRYNARCKADPQYVKPTAISPAERPLYLGTAIKQGLDAIGITQERVAALVESIGLPPSCAGCAKRQEKLDEFDRKVRDWLHKAKAWLAK